MDVRKVATQLSLKPKPPLTLKALIDKYAALKHAYSIYISMNYLNYLNIYRPYRPITAACIRKSNSVYSLTQALFVPSSLCV